MRHNNAQIMADQMRSWAAAGLKLWRVLVQAPGNDALALEYAQIWAKNRQAARVLFRERYPSQGPIISITEQSIPE